MTSADEPERTVSARLTCSTRDWNCQPEASLCCPGQGQYLVAYSTIAGILAVTNNRFLVWQRVEESVTFVQLIMTAIFLGMAYFLLLVFADFGSQDTAVQFGVFAGVLGAIVIIVRKMFPG
jgi:hypothetical protein